MKLKSQVALLKQKNSALLDELDAAKDVSDAIKVKNDEIDDLYNKIEALANKVSAGQTKYTEKCNEFDALLSKHKHAEKAAAESAGKIGRLTLRLKDAQSTKMATDDEAVPNTNLKQYNVQMRKDVGKFRTKFELEREAFEQHKKADDARDVVREIKIEEVQHKRIADLSEIDRINQLYGDEILRALHAYVDGDEIE